MTKTITARYDGRAIHPDEPLPLPRDTRLTITVHAAEPDAGEGPLAGAGSEKPRRKSFADAVKRLRIDGPSDWSERVDYYMGKDLSGGGA